MYICTFNLQIFNHWGEKVFETSTLENSWDGTFRAKKWTVVYLFTKRMVYPLMDNHLK